MYIKIAFVVRMKRSQNENTEGAKAPKRKKENVSTTTSTAVEKNNGDSDENVSHLFGIIMQMRHRYFTIKTNKHVRYVQINEANTVIFIISA